MYTSLDDNDDGFYDNYISRVSLPPSIIPITTPTTATLPTSTLSNVTKTTTPSLRDTPSRSVSFDDDYPSDASFRHQQHADKQHETGWGRGHPPNFFSHPNGTVIRVLSPKNNQTILEPTTLIELSEEFTKDAQEQALLQGPKV